MDEQVWCRYTSPANQDYKESFIISYKYMLVIIIDYCCLLWLAEQIWCRYTSANQDNKDSFIILIVLNNWL